MKKLGKIISVLLLVAVMLVVSVVPAFAATYPTIDPEPDPVTPHHEWTFKGFEWHINAGKRIYKAFGVYECSHCGTTRNVQATVTVTDSEYIATISASASPDRTAHTEHLHIDKWVFQGFEWNTDNGYIAFAVYQCSTCGEICRIQATVTRTARGYRASISATQAPDGVSRSATYNVSVTPVVGPVIPRGDGLIKIGEEPVRP